MLSADYLNPSIDRIIGSDADLDVYPGYWFLGLTFTETTPSSLGEEPEFEDGYQRILILNDDANWGPAVDGLKANLNTVEMGPAAVTWGSPTNWFLSPASGGPTFTIAGTISGLTILKNHAPYFPPGSLVVGVE